MRILGGHHVSAFEGSLEGWQKAPQLECGGELVRRQRAGGATPRLVAGRNQLDPGTGMAALDRGDASREGAAAHADAVPGGSLRRAVAGQFDRPSRKLSAVQAATAAAIGTCWLTLELWRGAGASDRVWTELLDRSREGTRWNQVLFALVAYRPLAPGSESRLHGEWFERIAATTGFNVSFDLLLYDLTRTILRATPVPGRRQASPQLFAR